jgi:hypothetical protein
VSCIAPSVSLRVVAKEAVLGEIRRPIDARLPLRVVHSAPGDLGDVVDTEAELFDPAWAGDTVILREHDDVARRLAHAGPAQFRYRRARPDGYHADGGIRFRDRREPFVIVVARDDQLGASSLALIEECAQTIVEQRTGSVGRDDDRHVRCGWRLQASGTVG